MAKCTSCNNRTFYKNGYCEGCYWHYNMVKARVAESIIEQLFLASKYSVFRYGMENTVPGIMQLLKNVKTEVALNIRRMPDFVIQKEKESPKFVEVKFRKDGRFSIKDLEKDYGEYPYKEVFIIVVSKTNIKCIKIDELKDNKEIKPDSNDFQIIDRNEFSLDKQKTAMSCDLAVKFFKDI